MSNPDSKELDIDVASGKAVPSTNTNETVAPKSVAAPKPAAAQKAPKVNNGKGPDRQAQAQSMLASARANTLAKPNPTPIPQPEDGELVVLSAYHSFVYGGRKYSFQRGVAQRVTPEIKNLLKKAKLI